MNNENTDMALPIVNAIETTNNDQKKILNDFQDELRLLIPSAGTLELSEEQKEIVYASINDASVEIREDGLIYLPWMEYADRLRKAFGMSWCLIPQGTPKVSDDMIIWGFHLLIKGKYCGHAVGGQRYIPTNRQMTWDDACEGAKSNALMRLCKGIGIGLELWKPSFTVSWRSKYAEQVWRTDKYGSKKQVWKKKGDQELKEEPVVEQNPQQIKFEHPSKSPEEAWKELITSATQYKIDVNKVLKEMGIQKVTTVNFKQVVEKISSLLNAAIDKGLV